MNTIFKSEITKDSFMTGVYLRGKSITGRKGIKESRGWCEERSVEIPINVRYTIDTE